MNREEIRLVQFACLWSIIMDGCMAFCMSYVGLPKNSYIVLVGFAICHLVMFFCFILQHGYMPKDHLTVQAIIDMLEEEKQKAIKERNLAYDNMQGFSEARTEFFVRKLQEDKMQAIGKVDVLEDILKNAKED